MSEDGTLDGAVQPVGEGGRRRGGRRTRATLVRFAVLALAAGGVTAAGPAEQASAAGCATDNWASLGQPVNLTIAGEYAGQAVLEWNSCPGIPNYKVRGRFQWSYYFDNNPPAGLTGVAVDVQLAVITSLSSQWHFQVVADSGFVGNTQEANIPVGGKGGNSGYGAQWAGINRYEVTIATATTWSDGSEGGCQAGDYFETGLTQGHDFTNGAPLWQSYPLDCPTG